MCPCCFATFGLAVAAQPSTGRLATLAVNISRKKIGTREVTPISNERKGGDVNGHNR